MSSTTQAQADEPARIRWTHSGIEAPYRLSVLGINTARDEYPVGYEVDLWHPTLEVVGRVINNGTRWTRFVSDDPRRFSAEDLEGFVALSRHEGRPMAPGRTGIAAILNAVVYEVETREQVGYARIDGGFATRLYRPPTEHVGSWRGDPVAASASLLLRTNRPAFVAQHATQQAHHVARGAYWQIFTGRDWVPLLPGPTLAADQTAARIAAVADLPTRTDRRGRVIHRQLLDDGFYVYGDLDDGYFILVGDDQIAIDTTRWCRCPPRYAEEVRFEMWSTTDGLLGAGAIHNGRDCRQLLAID